MGQRSSSIAASPQSNQTAQINQFNNKLNNSNSRRTADMSSPRSPSTEKSGKKLHQVKSICPQLTQHKRTSDRVITTSGGAKQYEDDVFTGKQPRFTRTSNAVISSKYTLLTFLPLNLFEQFLNLANLYFLFVGILQLIPAVSTTNGVPTQYIPLAFIVTVSAIRAAKEDYDKHASDKKRNSYPYQVLRNGHFKKCPSGSIQVGDIVKVAQNDMIPADMLFIGSALPKGHCFIDKSNLNGETRLEVMNSHVLTKSLCSTDEGAARAKISLVYEAPNKRFDAFRGHLMMHDASSNGAVQTADGKVLLMRETNLRNCDYIYGLVVYTGNDTKIQRSNLEGDKPRLKVSRVFRRVNVLLRYMLVLQIVLCIIGAIIASSYRRSNVLSQSWYIQVSTFSGAAQVGLETFFSWFILLSSMVPISLIVSQELVKFVQSIFIQWDIALYSQTLNKPTKCNSSTIHEDLGLIDYIFSDKTGTLTCNRMEFRYVLLEHAEYGSKETDIAKSVKARQLELEMRQHAENGGDGGGASSMASYQPPAKPQWSQLLKPHLAKHRQTIDREPRYCTPLFLRKCWSSTAAANHDSSSSSHSPRRADEDTLEDGSSDDTLASQSNMFTDEERQSLLRALWGAGDVGDSPDEVSRKRATLRRYMTHMALSNTVKPFDDNGTLKFQAESAEELAMVQFAQTCGFTKKSINPTVLEVKEYATDLIAFKSVTETYNHVATMGFTNKRARVSVVYQRTDSGAVAAECIHVMTKGQDSTTLPLIRLDGSRVREDELLIALKNMATNGLRTLICGYALLPLEWWTDRKAGYTEVIGRDTSSASEGHPEKCNHAKCEKCASHSYFGLMEEDARLQYAGCIGLEDQLQALVPETLRDCLAAGIKVMVLTGDKAAVARQIALACNLIDPDMLTQVDSHTLSPDAIEQYQNSRLIEITGQWAGLASNREEMSSLFDSFDHERKGRIAVKDLSYLLKALRCSIGDEQLAALLSTGAVRSPTSDATYIVKEQFIRLMQSTSLTPYQAVKYDLDQGIKTYNAISDHTVYPVSILIDKTAFLVMFPGKAKKSGLTSLLSTDDAAAGGAGATGQDANSTHASDAPAAASTAKDAPHEPTDKELDELRRKFFVLASRAKSVVFARAEPAMKKRMVTEVQAREPDAITLAIGDGANDTDMIQAAHIGVGIAGVEGTAATNAADYAIGTFRMLHTLLFVHGFWSYQRQAKLVHFIFYKASLLALSMYLFGFFSVFSGQQFFNDPPYQLYNVVFTALPVMFVAVLDRPLDRVTCENNPLIYKKSKGMAFTDLSFFAWILRAALHALLIFFIPYAVFAVSNVNSRSGRAEGLWFFSTNVFYCCVLCPTLLILYEMNTVSFLSALSIIISLACLYLFVWILNIWLSLNPDLYGVVSDMYRSGPSWLTILFAVGCVLLLEYALRAYQRERHPHVWQVFQERARLARAKPADAKSIEFAQLAPQASRQHLAIPEVSRSHFSSRRRHYVDTDGAAQTDEHAHMRLNLIRAMLRFRQLAGSQFDSAADAALQRHDGYTDAAGHVHQGANAPDTQRRTSSQATGASGGRQSIQVQPQQLHDAPSLQSQTTSSTVNLRAQLQSPNAVRSDDASPMHAHATNGAASALNTSHSNGAAGGVRVGRSHEDEDKDLTVPLQQNDNVGGINRNVERRRDSTESK